jgi:hypothetical protein
LTASLRGARIGITSTCAIAGVIKIAPCGYDIQHSGQFDEQCRELY